MKKIVVTWMYLDDKGEQSQQQNGDTSITRFLSNYWRCVVVFFESSLRYNEDAEHILFTNTLQPPVIDGFDIKAYLDRNNIKLICIDNAYPLPDDYFHSWQNQFYIFSILNYLKDTLSDQDKMILLDSDCIFRKPIDEAFEQLETYDALSYAIRYEEDRVVQGISCRQMQQLFADLGLKLKSPPCYSGGEVVFANGKFIKAVSREFHQIYRQFLELPANKTLKCNLEEVLLNYFYHKYNGAIGGMNKYFNRLWLNPYTLRTAKEEDRGLSIWHMPAEKKNGLKQIYQLISRGLDLKNQAEQDYQHMVYKKLFDEKKYHTFSFRFRRMMGKIKHNYLKPIFS